MDAMCQKAMTAYWRLSTQRERLAYLAAQYYDLMEYAEEQKGEYAQRALQYHVTDYILKPITRAKFNSLEERLIAIQSELSADVPPWYAGDETLRMRVSEALHKGDMAAMGELLISDEVSESLSDRKDV